jgi:hypothetical protein
MLEQNVIDAAFERVPPKFRRDGTSHKYYWSGDLRTPDPFDEVSPIAVRQGKLRDNHRLLARRVEQINCRLDARCPLHLKSVRFDVLRDRGFGARGGHKNHCSCSVGGLHQISNTLLIPRYARRPPIGRKPP